MKVETYLYHYIDGYAASRKLENTRRALPVAKKYLEGLVRRSCDFDSEGTLQLTYYMHCMEATKTLIDLKVPLTHEEEDILLAATLSHDILGHVELPNYGEELVIEHGLDRRILDIVRIITRPHPFPESDKYLFYNGIMQNKLALLLAMADRGNLVERLYGLSIQEALDYVQEIRRFALPMCIYALEHYPDVSQPISIMMGKIRNLIDVTDIISHRYKERERDYDREIMSLLEENARIRGLILQMGGKL